MKKTKKDFNNYKKTGNLGILKFLIFIMLAILVVIFLMILGNQRLDSQQQKQSSVLRELKNDLQDLKYKIVKSKVKNEKDHFYYLSSQPVPPSKAVSKEFYKSLVSTPQPSVGKRLIHIPETKEEWTALINIKDKRNSIVAKTIAEKYEVNIRQDNISGVNVYWVTPKYVDPKLEDKLLVYIHGGAFMFNGGLASTLEASIITSYANIPALVIDYSKGPDFPAPAARDDITAVWEELLESRDAKSMVMGGTSAGATLTMVAVQDMVNLNLPVPAALYLGTPAIEISMIGDSRFINEGMDRTLVAWRGILQAMADVYKGDNDPYSPIVSPAYGSFRDFPPTYLITGTRDLLLSDTVRTHRRLRREGVEADLNVYEGQSHGDYISVLDAPESKEHYNELSDFFRKHLLKKN